MGGEVGRRELLGGAGGSDERVVVGPEHLAAGGRIGLLAVRPAAAGGTSSP